MTARPTRAQLARAHADPAYGRALATSESDFQKAITDLADRLGYRWMHIQDSRGMHAEGWPDLAVAVPPVLYLWELKDLFRIAEPEQIVWLEHLSRCTRVESGLYRPDSEDELIAKILEGR